MLAPIQGSSRANLVIVLAYNHSQPARCKHKPQPTKPRRLASTSNSDKLDNPFHVLKFEDRPSATVEQPNRLANRLDGQLFSKLAQSLAKAERLIVYAG